MKLSKGVLTGFLPWRAQKPQAPPGKTAGASGSSISISADAAATAGGGAEAGRGALIHKMSSLIRGLFTVAPSPSTDSSGVPMSPRSPGGAAKRGFDALDPDARPGSGTRPGAESQGSGPKPKVPGAARHAAPPAWPPERARSATFARHETR